jgi:hypothetical protein
VAVIAIIFGAGVILAGIFGKTFYSGDIWGGSISDEPIPRWFGRLGFISIGAFLFVGGIVNLVSGR